MHQLKHQNQVDQQDIVRHSNARNQINQQRNYEASHAELKRTIGANKF